MPGIMKVLLLITAAVLAVGHAVEETCYDGVVQACDIPSKPAAQQPLIPKCHAKYGAINALESDLQKFSNRLIHNSFDFLLMATHYGNYIKNRPGFEKLFRGLSDELWQDGIDTIKYITSRGGVMNFANVEPASSTDSTPLELYELHSLGKALDIEKKIAEKAFDLHKEASGRKSEHHDPEIAHHLEEKFMEKHRDMIRTLAGHAKDLSSILDGPDTSLGLYLFDEYLQK